MDTKRRRRETLFVIALAIVILSIPSLASARGPVNRFYPGRSSNPGVRVWQRPTRAYSYNRSNQAQTVRSFSYAPASFRAGDTVVVTAEEASLKSGTETLGTAMKGQKFVVQKVEGPWLSAKIEGDGKTINGWVWNRHVSMDRDLTRGAPSSDKTVAQSRSRTVPTHSYRRPYRTNRRYRR